jgi:hypothetical protein
MKSDEINAQIAALSGAHFRLLWIAGGDASKRHAHLQEIAKDSGVPLLDVGKMLSAALLDLPVKLRAVSAEECFHDLLKEGAGDVRCLEHLDILFDQSLQLDAISLIKNSSRRFTLVASWPGVHKGDMLSYGSPDHPSFVQFTPVKDEQTLHVIQ